MTRRSRITAFCLALVFLLTMPLLFAFSSRAEEELSDSEQLSEQSLSLDPTAEGDGVYKSLSELKGKRIAVEQGTFFDKIVEDSIDGAELVYFSTTFDYISSLKANRIDAFAVEEPTLRVMMKTDPALTYVPEYMDSTDYGFVFAKTDHGRQLNEEMSEFIRKCKQDGTLQELNDIWFGDDESRMVTEDYEAFPDTRGTLTMATSGGYVPFVLVKDGKTVGYDVDLAARFCKEYGYRLKVGIMDFEGIIPSVQTGKCDFGGNAISISEERKESVDFSESYYGAGAVLGVLKEDNDAVSASFADSIGESFEKTFIREDRYKLFLSGIGTTLLITVLSILFGTILGFLIFMACRKGNKIANVLAGIFNILIHGMPIVVLLMILYYIIFAKSQISGTAVSIIAFTMVFGSAVFGMLKTGVGAIDKGQTEAAWALGYGDLHAFFRFILPQALPHFLPAYKGEVVSLLKATAVVGYIAVQDLTKMGDIVRGRTYEAFFPLIAVAIIYFAIAGLLILLVSRFEISINPKRRKKSAVLKGVKDQ